METGLRCTKRILAFNVNIVTMWENQNPCFVGILYSMKTRRSGPEEDVTCFYD